MNNDLHFYYQEKKRQEAIEHRDVLLAIAAIIKTDEGRKLFKYFFKNLEVATLPDRSLEGNTLHEALGFLRAGNSIYKLACESASETAASILAKIERERYEDLYEQHRLENGINAYTSESDS